MNINILRRIEIFIKDKYDNIIHSEATALCKSDKPIEVVAAKMLFNNRHKILENPGSKAVFYYTDNSGYVWKCTKEFKEEDLKEGK